MICFQVEIAQEIVDKRSKFLLESISLGSGFPYLKISCSPRQLNLWDFLGLSHQDSSNKYSAVSLCFGVHHRNVMC